MSNKIPWIWPALMTLGALIAAALLTREDEEPVARPLPQSAYIPPDATAPARAPLKFSEATTATGINFQHSAGAFTDGEGSESRYMPETMGPGVVLFDYDGDGDSDIFVANSQSFDLQRSEQAAPTARMYRNDGAMRFTDVSLTSRLDVMGHGMGAAAADYDGDGRRDLLYTQWGGIRLLRNTRNGSFVDVTSKVGLDAANRKRTGVPPWATSAAFFDADGDNVLDLFVAYYVEWSPDMDVFATLDGRRKSYAKPDVYPGTSCRLFLQRDGQFVDVSQTHGVLNSSGKALGVSIWDFNRDGHLDIAVANDTQPNFLFESKGDGRFEERGLEAGIAYDENGATRAGMGIDVADIANDASAAIAIGNFSREPVSVFKETAPGFFREASQQAGVAAPTYLSLTFGLAFADLDLDGWQDLVIANGHIEPYIQDVEAEVSYRQPVQVLGNNQSSGFIDWSKTAGQDLQRPIVGRGLALGDLDADGDLDMVVTENNGPLHVFRNDLPEAGKRFLRVRVVGRAPNMDAIGAQIELHSGGMVQRRLVRTGSSYLSQSELTQTFGIPSNASIDQLVVIWPSGERSTLNNVQLNSSVVVREG